MKKANIFLALVISFLLVKFLKFSEPTEFITRATAALPVVNDKIYSYFLNNLSKKSYARGLQEIEIYYKGKRMKIRFNRSKLSSEEKKFFFELNELINEMERKER